MIFNKCYWYDWLEVWGENMNLDYFILYIKYIFDIIFNYRRNKNNVLLIF